jgi:hypothetical protein
MILLRVIYEIPNYNTSHTSSRIIIGFIPPHENRIYVFFTSMMLAYMMQCVRGSPCQTQFFSDPSPPTWNPNFARFIRSTPRKSKSSTRQTRTTRSSGCPMKASEADVTQICRRRASSKDRHFRPIHTRSSGSTSTENVNGATLIYQLAANSNNTPMQRTPSS